MRFAALPMILFREPSDASLSAYLARQAEQSFSYDCSGCTGRLPLKCPGWNIDAQRVLLGHGQGVFQRACRAIDTWQMFPPQMTHVAGCEKPRAGLNVVVVYRSWLLPLVLVMPARVVYVVDETVDERSDAVARYGFAYGTLPDHPERGEERFLVERDRATDAVHYDLVAVSQPAHWLARLGFLYARFEQWRFRRLSGRAMQRAVTAFRP